jgi:cytochrome c oxidase subunit 3
MATAEHAHSTHHHHPVIEFTPKQRLQMNRVGFWLFIISEVFLFSGILVARIVLLGGSRPELDQALGLLITSVLLASSFFVNRAEVAIAFNDRRNFLFSLFMAIVLGTVFTVGVGYEWSLALEHFAPDEGIAGGMFFFMTGMHALHVITGILFLIIIFYTGLKGHYNSHKHFGVEAAAIYWHFVDVVWVFFYVALYLVGTPVE